MAGRKPKERKNICATCRFLQRCVIVDAYGKKYQSVLCLNVSKSGRDKVRRISIACKHWECKTQPTSGDWCSFLREKITYKENAPKTSLPCFKCNARCVYSHNKKERDFTNHARYDKPMLMEDIMQMREEKE